MIDERLEKIRKRQGVSYSGDKEFLIRLIDKQRTKLDACARQVQGWERTAVEMASISGTTATMICASELKELLNG